ncbi:MAG: hypothetical protein DRP35_00780 [Candidatus Zixiibacteriota bacterium]|nr:MAG: hypothetical protein DRP35_00780 [candidate division Zixibacteria bacterium]
MKKHSILVVDDELLIRDLLYDFFNSQGWEVKVAGNGEKAMQIVENEQVDLVLTDIRMPEMDGLFLTKQIKDNHPELPVVVMTGFPSVDTAVEALRSKVADYIVKPFNINKLYKVIEKELGK